MIGSCQACLVFSVGFISSLFFFFETQSSLLFHAPLLLTTILTYFTQVLLFVHALVKCVLFCYVFKNLFILR